MTDNASAIFEGLNSEQRNAVSSVDGPVLIVAGAGSGKTRVLTSRIAYLIERGCDPSRILSLTFTKKAAGEMKERIALMVGQNNARKICMGTFHSVFIRFLRDYAEVLNYPKDFTIYDQNDSTTLIKHIIKDMGMDEKVYKPKDVLSRISEAKNRMVDPIKYAASANAIAKDAQRKMPRIVDIYLNYWKRCRASGVMDFDDILMNMVILFHEAPNALEEISSRFDYLLVDEYQDTNNVQYRILMKLSQRHHNLCVVGDESQSIYAFRGADISNILNFQKDFPGAKLFRLERNYRSTSTIVDASNSLIEKNTGRIPKKCYSEGEKGEKIKLINAFTEKDESSQVVSEIIRRIGVDKAQYKDFAILYRVNNQSRSLEEQLRLRNIPYRIYSGHSFFDRQEVKDMMSYFKLITNVRDDEAFR
ncbi:MAG: UvrD-helicase domain-containing protein, partial [Bacteroidales bacterium]|nr:UvrD-helicase domain-containing protein [Bacteroidales bacterium]